MEEAEQENDIVLVNAWFYLCALIHIQHIKLNLLYKVALLFLRI